MKSLEIVLALAGRHADEEEKEHLCALKNGWYLDLIKEIQPSDALPGVPSFIEELKELGILIALGSASRNATVILERLALLDYFDVIVDGNDIANGKPDPEVFQLAAARLDLEPQECLVFEDAANGIVAAHRAGMKVVGIGSQSALGEADLVVPGFASLEPTQILTQMANSY